MNYPITNRYMDLNAERLGKDSAQAQHVRAALQAFEERFIAPGKSVGEIVINSEHLKAISFEPAVWESLAVGDIIYTPAKQPVADALEPLNFDLTYTLPAWAMAPGYAHGVTVEFDGAEGAAVWLSRDDSDESVAIRGPEAMRELARMLLAFAEGYTAPLEGAANES